MKLGNMTGVDKVWVPLVIAAVAVALHYNFISTEQASFLTDNAPIFGVMCLQAAAVFLTANKA